MRALVAGATGFLGRYVVQALLGAGHEVIGLCRNPERAALSIPMLRADVAEGSGLDQALAGVDVAYYLVHSFEQTNEEGFASRDRRAARHFGAAARKAGVQRIVYCGVSPASRSRSETAHRKSRAEVFRLLQEAVPDSVCLRTWTILSPSNQFVRFLLHLLHKRSVVTLPPSSRYRYQPIDARDLAAALVAAASCADLAGKVIDVAGPTVVDTKELCLGLCEQLGLERRLLVLPFSPPDALLRALIRAARLDPTLILSGLSSARVGDVVPAQNWLGRLIATPHSLRESLAYAAQTVR